MPPSPSPDRPLRRAVGIALFNAQGHVWMGRRISSAHRDAAYQWQLPQGGIDPGEGPEAAAFRELFEETGARSARIIGEVEDWLDYEFPRSVFETLRRRHRGQTQKWFAMLFTGEDNEFDLEVHHPEFDAWRWVPLADIPDLVIPFKRHVYEAVATEFAPLAEKLVRGETV
ncbi:MAG: RNA pyrophosphohydrolase [Alphaproteobacteria bacterium]